MWVLKRKTTALGAVMLMLSLLAAGCGGSSSSGPGSGSDSGSGSGSGAGSFEGQTLIVTSYGGTWQEFMEAEILPDFEQQTGANVELAVGLAKDWLAQLRAAGKDNPPYDVVIANEAYISTARMEGFFDPLPEDKVPNLKDVHPKLRMPDDVGVLGLVGPLGIAYRTDLVDTPPKSWLDLKNYDGKVGIYNIVNSAAPQHLMMLAKILTGDPKNWETGLEWLKEACPFKQTDFGGDMEQLLLQGEVHVGILDAPAAARLKQQGAPIEWVAPEEGLFMFEQNMNVTSGSKVKDLAYAFINYMLSEPVQKKWAEKYYWTPANTKVTIEGELAELIPITADEIDTIEKWDWVWLNSGPRDEMVDRWNREISGRCQ